jgi:putative transposase
MIAGMKLIARVRLNPTEKQASLLLQTLEKANAACNRISAHAWANRMFRQYDLHHALYHRLRTETGLAAQLVVRCTAKVADAYKLDRNARRTFKPHGAIAYDDRILSWEMNNRFVSVWTVKGRERIPFAATEHHQRLLNDRQGETDLVCRNGAFYLLAVCEVPDPDERDMDSALGVDLGVVNIAVTSDGETHTSEAIEHNRARHQRLRGDLQKRQTDSARRKLKKLAGRQSRFQRDVNHRISKRLVATAEHTTRAIALEDLTGLGARTRVKGKVQRARRSNWSFAQLRDFVAYKARRAGIPVKRVNPAYTSQRCFACGHLEKANRRSQSEFSCCACGHAAHADVNAAKNIAWAAFNQPTVGRNAEVRALDLQAIRPRAGGY